MICNCNCDARQHKIIIKYFFFFCRVMAEICRFFMRRMPCMSRMVQSKWFPVPAEVVRSLEPQE